MNVILRSILLVSLILLSVIPYQPAQAGIGDFDPSFAGFGTGGKVVTDIAAGNNNAFAVALQPNGKIVVAGSASGALAVARYDDNGVLDSTFASGAGYVRTPVGAFSRAHAVAVQGDGKSLP